ncbi:invasion associated locus B family protein [Agrobacterium salinitolerans]|uniref:Invasion associated locus B family protein n=1 Tax=Agrobacterium salinitolerans TaxID=1183413 RepID=A0A9X3KMG6_9HYPH|nr:MULTISPECIES: invasion associated locus B family protein [Agrobacterium]MCZ7854115.1 invasion associated locus B family protein [Agrobacterium salinitolerans]MCZ7892661.1 invasion associated locus B family protein [Agrobacterium salinitolerans]MCZ7937518.1 invasion associated locus B family protein [Agrobacterium salinitolerans]MCZ7976031.1 invasion associated locus B family protein [Agrobacterium salinitolerans]TRA85152.1 invasion associated locus B family protein [Agrobacterium salinitole
MAALVAVGLLLIAPAAKANVDDGKAPAVRGETSGVAAEAVVDTRRYGDWELVCKPQAAADTPKAESATCRLQQAQAVNGGKDVVFLFNIARQGKQRVAIISTPLNVYLPAGLELKIDGGQTQRVIFETCNISGCHAGFALNGSLLGALRKGNVLTVALKDTKATTIPLKVSLNGISAGIDALDAAIP